MQDEVSEQFRILHNEELCDLLMNKGEHPKTNVSVMEILKTKISEIYHNSIDVSKKGSKVHLPLYTTKDLLACSHTDTWRNYVGNYCTFIQLLNLQSLEYNYLLQVLSTQFTYKFNKFILFSLCVLAIYGYHFAFTLDFVCYFFPYIG
jgi:hypothetical protein